MTAKWFIGGVHTKTQELSLQHLKKELPAGMGVPLETPYSPDVTVRPLPPMNKIALEMQPLDPSTDLVSKWTDLSASTLSVAMEDSNAGILLDCRFVVITINSTVMLLERFML